MGYPHNIAQRKAQLERSGKTIRIVVFFSYFVEP